MKKKLIVSAIVFGALITSVFVGTSYAQDSVTDPGSGFQISPVRFDIDIDKGETITRFIELTNVTDATQSATAVVNDFAPSEDEGGQPQLLIGSQEVADYPYSIQRFVLPIDSVSIPAKETVTIPVTISVPNETAPGAYYGVVRFISGAGGTEDPGNVSLTASVGTIFLIQIPGETVELLSLEQISAYKGDGLGSVFSSAPDGIAIRLKNEGNTYIAPFGKVTITDWTGNVVHTYELNDVSPKGNVLPDSIRRFDNEISDIGSFGRFKVEANISYGDGGNIITARTSFWVIPWLTIGILLLVVVFVVFMATRGLKAYNNMIVKRSRGERVRKR